MHVLLSKIVQICSFSIQICFQLLTIAITFALSNQNVPMKRKILKNLIFCGLLANAVSAQQMIPLNNMDAFRPTQGQWSVVNAVEADFTKPNDLHKKDVSTGINGGILLCEHPPGKYGIEMDLLTKMEHGDLDLDLDFMMAKGSNSGIYLQGRYEIQLFDSWGKKSPKYGDLGGIYERWDDSKPEGSKGYQGVAPRINVAKAPGLWQNIKISFQAPRFDANGKKIANARILSIYVNNVLMHENVELTGETRGAWEPNEVAMGPLRFQGDHGNVAFRNIKYKSYNQKVLSFKDLKYGVYKGNFRTIGDIEKIKPELSGNLNNLNWAVTNAENEFAVKYAGKIVVPEAGTYTFTTTHGGNTEAKINGQQLFKNAWLQSDPTGRKATIELPAGEVPFELYYWKADGWLQPSLGLYAESATVRKHPLHTANSTMVNNPSSPILLGTAVEPVLLRSFMDIKEGDKNKRIVHAISVGNKENVHFTYNLDNGSLFQVWKGNFLNATPMWQDRGDGSSRPMGSLMPLGDAPVVAVLETPDKLWGGVDVTFRTRGYELDDNGQPTFKYDVYGAKVSDKIVPVEDGKILKRDIAVSGAVSNLYARLASADTISKNADGTYNVGDGSYMIKVEEGNASIRTIGGKQELIAPLGGKISYSIIW